VGLDAPGHQPAINRQMDARLAIVVFSTTSIVDIERACSDMLNRLHQSQLEKVAMTTISCRPFPTDSTATIAHARSTLLRDNSHDKLNIQP